MPTINFSQFPTSVPNQGWSPQNNYLVGYATINGQNVEQKYNMSTLVSDSLPGAGLGTKLHQIRKLATRTAETTLCMAAITKKEEVICWGQNFRIPNVSGWKLQANNLYTKFGSGFNTAVTSRAAVWQPVVIPFYSGTPNPTDNSVDILDLQKLGLTIVDLQWNEHYAIALLSDGTVWYKGFIGVKTNTGLGADIGSLPEGDSYFTSGFFEIRKLREKTSTVDTVGLVPMGKRIVKIMSLPVDIAPQWGGLFAAIADDKTPTTLESMSGPIYVWGNMPGVIGSDAQALPASGKASPNSTDIRRLASAWSNASVPGLSEPVDISFGFEPFVNRRFKDIKLSGGGWRDTGDRRLTDATIQVIDDWGRLWSIGSNKFGVCGTGTNSATAFKHHTNWSQAYWHQEVSSNMFTQDPGAPIALIGATQAQPNLPGAHRFLSLGLQNNVCGFISTPFTVAGSMVNRIYLSGTNREVGNNPELIYMNTNVCNWVGTSTRSNNVFRQYAQSEADNLFIKGVITNELNCIVITQKGQVWAAGDGRSGALGRTIIPGADGKKPTFVGPTFAKVTYKNKNNTTSSTFGESQNLSAIDVYWDDTAFTNGCIGIKVLNYPTSLGYDAYFAGSKTFSNINQSFGTGTNFLDFTFRCFPISDSLNPGTDLGDVAIGGFANGHLWTIILTNSGRTWGVGRGNHDFLFSTEPWGWDVYWSSWYWYYSWTAKPVYTEYETPIPQLIF
jgi:hypothetical protein